MIIGVQTRLRLDLTADQAGAFITCMAAESAQALGPKVMDRMHSVANFFR